jgi:hypothetical protein
MTTEFLHYEEKKVLVIIPKSRVPREREIIGNNCTFIEKDDGSYHRNTVAKGFSQAPGKDFQEHHATVVSQDFGTFSQYKISVGCQY